MRGNEARGASGQVAPAFELCLGRFVQLEIPGLDVAVGLIVRDDHARRIGLRFDQLQSGRNCSAAEETLTLAEHHGKISTLNSSTRPFFHNVCRKSLEPWTKRSGPSPSFSFFSEATMSLSSSWLLCQLSFGL